MLDGKYTNRMKAFQLEDPLEVQGNHTITRQFPSTMINMFHLDDLSMTGGHKKCNLSFNLTKTETQDVDGDEILD